VALPLKSKDRLRSFNMFSASDTLSIFRPGEAFEVWSANLIKVLKCHMPRLIKSSLNSGSSSVCRGVISLTRAAPASCNCPAIWMSFSLLFLLPIFRSTSQPLTTFNPGIMSRFTSEASST